jgi:hypothetical protein
MVQAFLNTKDSKTETYHEVGLNWWALYDMDSQKANWGLLTPRDNPYDGKSATISGIGGTQGNDEWGYPTGGEAGNYGNFIGPVAGANNSIYSSLMR